MSPHPPHSEPRLPRLSIIDAPPCELGSLLFDKSRTILSLDEIAAKLECSRTHVIHLIEAGDLGCINIGTGKAKYYRVPAAEWEKFLRKRAFIS